MAIGTGADERLAGAATDDTIDGRGGDDWLFLAGGNDTGLGGRGDDTVMGGAGNDRLFGEGGDDLLSGGSGDDILEGGLGHDLLQGGSGRDTLIAGQGNDTLVGGGGLDLFMIGPGGTTQTLLLDYQRREVVDFSLIDADLATGGDQAFVFEADPFDLDPGELSILYDPFAFEVYVVWDLAGDGADRFQYLRISGTMDIVGFDAADLVL